MRSALAGKISRWFCSALTALYCSSFFPTQLPAADTVQKSEANYYNRLRSTDFMNMMIPKEKYLLGLVKNVSEELGNRRSEGQSASDLGLDAISSPKELLKSSYDSEVRAMERLITQIEDLEHQAKRRVDLDVLKSLEQLKERLKNSLSKEIQDLKLQHEQQAVLSHGQSGASLKSGSAVSDPSSPTTLTSDEYEYGTGDLFEQWKYNRLLDYKLKLARYQFFRTKLRQNSNAVQSKRMFQRDLQQALQTFNSSDFKLARLQLQDVLDLYSASYILDDVLYYRCESAYALNYLDEALECYQKLSTLYPNSEYTTRAMVKMINIYFIYGDVNKELEVFDRLLIRRNQIDANAWGTTAYLVGYSQFKSGQFRQALTTLQYTGTGSAYYYPSIYLSAACYSNLSDNNNAIAIYKRLIETTGGPVNPMIEQMKNNAMLKLGLIYYEKGDIQQARQFFNSVPTESQNYDLSLLGDAWAAYREGRPAEALKSVDALLSDNLITNYMYEARVLAASSKELLGQKESALLDLKEVTQMGQTGKSRKSDKDRSEESESPQTLQEQILYREAKRIQGFLHGDEDKADFVSADPAELSEPQQKLQSEIAVLDQLENDMISQEDDASLSEIRQLRGQVIETLQDHDGSKRGSAASRDDAPLIRQMGMTEYLKYLFRSLLLETLSEKDKASQNIATARQMMTEAQKKNNFTLTLQMEINREELEDYYATLNQYEVWLKENLPQEFRIEVDQWTSLSSYGISNLYFSRIQEIDERNAQISRILGSLDRVFQDKRIKLEKRIQGLLSDVSRIETQMQIESERRKEQDRDNFFHNKYFNKQVKEPVVKE